MFSQDDQNESASSGGGVPDNMADALSILDSIKAILGDESSAQPETSFSLPMKDVLALVDSSHVTDASALEDATPVPVEVSDLYDQLKRGRVRTTLAQLVFGIPTHLISHEAINDKETLVTLPLPLVVGAIDPGNLKKRTAQDVRKLNTDDLPDPFKAAKAVSIDPDAPAVAPGQDTPAAEPAPEPEPVAAEPEVMEPEVLEPEVMEPEVMEPPAAATPPPTPEPAAAPAPEPPPAPAPAPEPAPAPPPVPEPAAAPPPVPQPAPAAAAASSAPVVDADDDYHETDLMGGVDLNEAGVDKLQTLPGVSPALAEAIVEHRQSQGGFKSVFDLASVDRLGRKTFKKITGMPYSQKHHHRRHKLAKLLGVPASDVTKMSLVAERVAARSGLAGCVLSDPDGLILAKAGHAPGSEAIAASAFRMFEQTNENLSLISREQVKSVTISAGSSIYTLAISDGICLTAIHERNKLTRSHVTFAQKVVDEVAWLMSHRGYVS